MPYIVTYKQEKDTGNYWKQKRSVVFKLTKETSTKKNKLIRHGVLILISN